jgi:endonuclease YncB( thermonuclease family)
MLELLFQRVSGGPLGTIARPVLGPLEVVDGNRVRRDGALYSLTFDAPMVQSQSPIERERGARAKCRLEELLESAKSVDFLPVRRHEEGELVTARLIIDGEEIGEIAVREGWGRPPDSNDARDWTAAPFDIVRTGGQPIVREHITVIDGDDITWAGQRYRLQGIDTPETVNFRSRTDKRLECRRGYQALNQLRTLIWEATSIQLIPSKKKRVIGNRIVAALLLDGTDVADIACTEPRWACRFEERKTTDWGDKNTPFNDELPLPEYLQHLLDEAGPDAAT